MPEHDETEEACIGDSEDKTNEVVHIGIY
jgi:hypothetical protein